MCTALSPMQERSRAGGPQALVGVVSLMIFRRLMLGVLVTFAAGLMDRIVALG